MDSKVLWTDGSDMSRKKAWLVITMTKARALSFALLAATLILLPLSGFLPCLSRPSISAKSHYVDPQFPLLARHCESAPPISSSEFYQRQKAVAQILHSLNASAYIAEPGANAQYFGNVSSNQWQLSERPLLFTVSPHVVNDEVEAKITVLTPSFEAGRARLLPIPSITEVTFAEWAEDSNPYDIVVSTLPPPPDGENGIIFVDGAIRHFIVDGLDEAAPKTKIFSAPMEIRQLRERKSAAEIELMKCANEVTLLAMRTVRDQMYIGIRESQVRHLMERALAAAGLQDIFALVLFGENAALPHGSGTDRALTKSDFTLIDTGGSLHGYNSDVTRTFALLDSTIASGNHIIWDHVREAQNVAADTARSGVVTSKVDEMARAYLGLAGHGDHFTHRLGHGIGLEGHEQPYLRGGSDDIIQSGHTFSNEPGVYIEGKVGVRLEDCFYINDEGLPVFLTAGVGGQAKNPWRI